MRGRTVKSTPFKLVKAITRFYGDDLGVELNCMDPCTTTEITSQITGYQSLMDFCEVNCHLSYTQLFEVLYNKLDKLDNLLKKHNFRLSARFHNSNKDIKDVVVVFNYTVDLSCFNGSEPEFIEIMNIINKVNNTTNTKEINVDYLWKPVGDDIDGENVSGQSGYSVAMSAYGNRLAIGAPYNDENGLDSGHVRVFDSKVIGLTN